MQNLDPWATVLSKAHRYDRQEKGHFRLRKTTKGLSYQREHNISRSMPNHRLTNTLIFWQKEKWGKKYLFHLSMTVKNTTMPLNPKLEYFISRKKKYSLLKMITKFNDLVRKLMLILNPQTEGNHRLTKSTDWHNAIAQSTDWQNYVQNAHTRLSVCGFGEMLTGHLTKSVD